MAADTSHNIPYHELHLFRGCKIMLMRNILLSRGCANGNQFIVLSCGRHFVEAMNIKPGRVLWSSGIFFSHSYHDHDEIPVFVYSATIPYSCFLREYDAQVPGRYVTVEGKTPRRRTPPAFLPWSSFCVIYQSPTWKSGHCRQRAMSSNFSFWHGIS